MSSVLRLETAVLDYHTRPMKLYQLQAPLQLAILL